MKDSILVIIAKEPQVGTTKTRLCPPLKLSEAAELFEALLDDTIDLASSLEGIDLGIAVTPPESVAYFKRKTPEGTNLIPVTCIDIGDCLRQVFEALFQRGYSKVLAFNSDGPNTPKEYIHKAVHLLDKNDVVFGPSQDGGYYLVGLKQLYAEIFHGITWSTSRVLTDSLTRAGNENLRVALLPEWYDVDTPKDVKRLWEEVTHLPAGRLIHTRRFFANLTPELSSILLDME